MASPQDTFEETNRAVAGSESVSLLKPQKNQMRKSTAGKSQTKPEQQTQKKARQPKQEPQVQSQRQMTTKKQPKPRRRVATMAQRRAANIRERRRMFNLNSAFDRLRKKVPSFAYEKRLSRIETLKLAIMYIKFMDDLVHDDAYAEKYKRLIAQASDSSASNYMTSAAYLSLYGHCNSSPSPTPPPAVATASYASMRQVVSAGGCYSAKGDERATTLSELKPASGRRRFDPEEPRGYSTNQSLTAATSYCSDVNCSQLQHPAPQTSAGSLSSPTNYSSSASSSSPPTTSPAIGQQSLGKPIDSVNIYYPKDQNFHPPISYNASDSRYPSHPVKHLEHQTQDKITYYNMLSSSSGVPNLEPLSGDQSGERGQHAQISAPSCRYAPPQQQPAPPQAHRATSASASIEYHDQYSAPTANQEQYNPPYSVDQTNHQSHYLDEYGHQQPQHHSGTLHSLEAR